MAQAISTSWQTDGSTSPKTNLPMNGYRLTGHGAATSSTDLVLASQLSIANYAATSTGTANSISIALPISVSAYSDGLTLKFKASATSTGIGATTINVDSVGAKAIKRADGNKIQPQDFVADKVYELRYNSTSQEFEAPSVGVLPSGSIVEFAGTTAPAGWLLCYGQAVSRTTYAALFAALSTTYGAGDGSTTFNLPDCRGRVSAGKDDMGGTSANRLTGQSGGLNGDNLGATGGAETHTLTSGQIPPLSGSTSTDGAHTHSGVITSIVFGSIIAAAPNLTGTSGNTGSAGSHSHSVTVNSGGGGAHNNVQPTIILNKIIKI